jgi:hypothetical protein
VEVAGRFPEVADAMYAKLVALISARWK